MKRSKDSQIWIERAVKRFIDNSSENTLKNENKDKAFETVLVGFSKGDDPLYEEYKNHFEKDRALSRRFEKIEIHEPPVPETVRILKGLRSRYEEHHDIIYTDSALKAATELSAKHINDRYLPDKAIDVIDEAGAFVRLSGSTRRKKINPSDIEKIVAKIAKIPTQSVSISDRAKLENLEELFRLI